jgi:beta-galactosidase
MSRFEVRNLQGAPTLFQDNRPVPAALYLNVRNLPDATKPWQPDPAFEQFRDAGFHLYQFISPVRFDDAYDSSSGAFPLMAFRRFDRLRDYLKLDPLAMFMIRVDTEPRGDESAWLRRYPEECEVLESRAKGIYPTPSYASRQWLTDGCAFLRAMIGYLRDSGLDRHVLGYLVGAGDSTEWVKVGPMEDWAGDYSPAMQRAFRRWLIGTYGDVKSLRESWGDPNADFAQDLVPAPAEQAAADIGLFKDPHMRRKAIDYSRFFSTLVAEDIDTLCGCVKAASDRQHLAGVFYGYTQEIVWNNGFFGQRLADADVEHMAGARSGHSGLARVLASPNVDFLCSPYSYGFRGVGGEGGFMSPEESVRIAGKLWISEEDMRTHLWPADSFYGQTRNTFETAQVLKRQIANLLTRGAGAWWCDWGKPEAGAFAETALMDIFRRSLELMREHLDQPDAGPLAEIAVVLDEESSFYRSTLNNYDIPAWRNRAWSMARLGAPHDCVLLSDVLAGRVRDYKLYVFPNLFHLSTADRTRLKALLRRDGRVALWHYAAGYADDERLGADLCEDLTGIRLRVSDRWWSVNLFISNFDHALTRDLPTATVWGTDMRLGPLFTVDDARAITLGTAVINQGRCEPGYAVQSATDWHSVYTAAPNPPPALLRSVARFAGVHIFSDSDDVFFAGRGFFALHTVRAGEKAIELPAPANVSDAYDGRAICGHQRRFTDKLDAGETRIYRVEPSQPDAL